MKKLITVLALTFCLSIGAQKPLYLDETQDTGKRYGAETVQLYIGDQKSTLVRPIKEMKSFQKVYLQPGETKTISFTIGKDALSYFDDKRHEWIAEPGVFTAFAAAASDDVKSQCNFTLK